MTTQSEFDLVVANYNNGQYLQELVASIEEQSFENWHLIVVDDFSKDKSRNILSELKHNPRVSVLFNTKNKGVCATFDRGIRSGNAPLVGLIGADDTLPPQAISKMVEAFAIHNDASMIYSECMNCDSEMNPMAIREGPTAINPEKHITEELYKIFNFIAFRRTAYNNSPGLDHSLRKAMDHDLAIKLYEEGEITFLPEPLYNYRCHENGISQGSSGTKAAQYSLLAQIRSSRRPSRNPMPQSMAKRKAYNYHIRSVLMTFSCENKSLLHHALQSFSHATSLNQLRTSFIVLIKSVTR